MRILKFLFSLVIVTILLLVVAIIALPQFVNPNDYKPQISQAVKKHTGMDLTIGGKLSLSVFPWIGVNVEQVSLSQPKTILASIPDAGDFASIEAVDVKVKLKPLFSKKVEVDTILLQRPQIEMITDAKGNTSLDGLSTGYDEEANQTVSIDNSIESNSDNSAKALAALTIAGVNITDGRIVIDDRETKTRYEVSTLTITSGNVLGGEGAPLSIRATLNGTDLPTVTTSLDTQLRFNKEQLSIAINDLTLSIQQAQNNLKATIENIQLDGSNHLVSITQAQLSGSAEAIPFSLMLPKVTLDNKKAIVTIPSLHAEALGVNINGKALIKDWDKDLVASGKLATQAFNAQSVLKKLAIDYQPTNANALTNVSLSSSFSGTPIGASLKSLNVVLDKTTLKGDVSIFNFEKQQYNFDLSLNEIIIDDYLPLTEKTAEIDTAAAKPLSANETLAAPIVLLKDIYANGTFRANKITVNNMAIENNVITVTSNAKRVEIKPSLDLYQGKMNGKITLQKTKNPSLNIVTNLQKISLEPLLIAAEITDQFSGIGNLSTNLMINDTNGKKNSKGTIKISARDGAIKGVDIKKILDDAQDTIDKFRGKQTTISTNSSEDTTRFAEMSATLLLNNDVITNKDLSVKAPAFRIAGDGIVNLASQKLDYLTTINIVNTNSGQGGKDLSNLKGIKIPVRFSGSLTAPKYKIDTKALLKANTKQKVDQKKNALKAKLLEKIGVEKTEANSAQQKKEAKEALKEKLKKKLFDKLF